MKIEFTNDELYCIERWADMECTHISKELRDSIYKFLLLNCEKEEDKCKLIGKEITYLGESLDMYETLRKKLEKLRNVIK